MKKLFIILLLATFLITSCEESMNSKFERAYQNWKTRMEEFADWNLKQASAVASFDNVKIDPNTIYIFDMYEMAKLNYLADSMSYTIMKDFYDEMCVRNHMPKKEFLQRIYNNRERIKPTVGAKIDAKNDILANAYKYMANVIRINGPIKQVDRAMKKAERDFDRDKWKWDFFNEEDFEGLDFFDEQKFNPQNILNHY